MHAVYCAPFHCMAVGVVHKLYIAPRMGVEKLLCYLRYMRVAVVLVNAI